MAKCSKIPSDNSFVWNAMLVMVCRFGSARGSLGPVVSIRWGTVNLLVEVEKVDCGRGVKCSNCLFRMSRCCERGMLPTS